MTDWDFSSSYKPVHYNRWTGLLCSCPWGGRIHRPRLAGQQINKLLKAPDKKFKTPEGEAFLDRLQQELGEQHDSLAPFIAQRWKKGEIKHDGPPGNRLLFAPYSGGPPTTPLEHYLPDWHHWFEARQHPTRRGINIMDPDFTVWDMQSKVREHQEALERERQIQEDLQHGDVDMRFPNGWHVRHLTSPGTDTHGALEGEGNAMGHCIGSESQPYQECADQGNIDVFSLRDASGWPHGTWHTNNSDHTIAEVFGNADRDLSPEQQEMYEEWCENRGYNRHPVGHQEDAYDATVTLPAADNMNSYLDLHSDEGDYSGYYPDDANIGDNTDIEFQEPEWYNIAQDLHNESAYVRYGYGPHGYDLHKGTGLPGMRREVYETALDNSRYGSSHMDALHRAMQEYGEGLSPYDPEDPEYEAYERKVQEEWNQYRSQFIHPLTGEFVQPGYGDKPITEQFQPHLFDQRPNPRWDPLPEDADPWAYNASTLPTHPQRRATQLDDSNRAGEASTAWRTCDPVAELKHWLDSLGEASTNEHISPTLPNLPSVHHRSPMDFALEAPVSPSAAIGIMPPGNPSPKGVSERSSAASDELGWSGYGHQGKGLMLDDGRVMTWDVNQYGEPHHQEVYQERVPDRLTDADFASRHLPFNINEVGMIDNSWHPEGYIAPEKYDYLRSVDPRFKYTGEAQNGEGFGHARGMLDSMYDQGQMKYASGAVMYHVSPQRNRESITKYGLDAVRSNGLWWQAVS